MGIRRIVNDGRFNPMILKIGKLSMTNFNEIVEIISFLL